MNNKVITYKLINGVEYTYDREDEKVKRLVRQNGKVVSLTREFVFLTSEQYHFNSFPLQKAEMAN